MAMKVLAKDGGNSAQAVYDSNGGGNSKRSKSTHKKSSSHSNSPNSSSSGPINSNADTIVCADTGLGSSCEVFHNTR